jgi:SAM-dependent methyltransferase
VIRHFDIRMSAFDQKKWDAKYSAGDAPSQPSAVLASLAGYLPARGRALDLAGGAGRHAIWLAKRGLDATLADISPVGLDLARQRAAEEGLNLHTLQIDLEQQPLELPPLDLIVSVCYLWRPLFAELPHLLNPGGTLVVIQPTKHNLERNEKPPEPYLLEEGELLGLAAGLEILHYEEGWLADNRHDAVLVARKCF